MAIVIDVREAAQRMPELFTHVLGRGEVILTRGTGRPSN